MNSTYLNNSKNIQSPISITSSKAQSPKKVNNLSHKKESSNISTLISTTTNFNNTSNVPKNSEKRYEFLVSDESIYKNNIPKIPELPVSQYTVRPSNLKLISKSKTERKFQNIYSNVVKKNKILIKNQKNKLGPLNTFN
jgi:hypothetical protein